MKRQPRELPKGVIERSGQYFGRTRSMGTDYYSKPCSTPEQAEEQYRKLVEHHRPKWEPAHRMSAAQTAEMLLNARRIFTQRPDYNALMSEGEFNPWNNR